MTMAHTLYHRVLRVSALTTALVLLFQSGIIVPITKQLSVNALDYVANSTSVVARVEQNELNTLTAELTARETELAKREAALREIEARDFGKGETGDYSTYILSLILFVLTLLIITNYVLDWRRARLMEAV